jgi:predicted enzyme related to lactoylglutathione lyase
MTATTPGTPNWVDLGSPDVEASKRFYGDLFGWEAITSTEPEAMGYSNFTKNGRQVAGVGPLQSPEQPPVWTTYVATADADATAARVEAAGGKVVMAPMDVMRYGRMAIFTDSAGAAFGAWQAGEHGGAEVFNEPGSLTWNELTTRDPDGSKVFYSGVFAWDPQDAEFGDTGVTYTTWRLGGAPVGGMMPMVGEAWPPDLPNHWMVYFAVDDVDATAAKAAELGGAVSVPPTDIGPGRFAVLSDPAGASFSIIKLDPDFRRG